MTSRFKILLLAILAILISNNSFAQDKSNRGKEFWLAYGFDYTFFNESPVNSQEFVIYISTEQAAATVTVSISNTGYSQTLTIPANTVDASIILPKSGPNDARTLSDGLQNRNVHISSDVPVAVYAHVYATQVSGATMLMPVETYGYSYYSINYYQTTSQSSPNDWYSWFYVVASEDNTTVEITPSDTTKNGWLPGQSYTVNLSKGQSYHVFGRAIFDNNAAHASKDMTGSKIISKPGANGSCHPVAVFSGSGGIRLCRGDGGEFVHQQVFPSQAWGTRYLTYHTVNNTNNNITETFRNYYRICVLDPTTIVKKNGVVMTGLIKNFFYEHMDSTGGDYFTADKPIQVAQYTPNKNQCWNFPTTTPSPPSYGDPEMFYISPIEQGQKSVLFYTSRKSSIDYVYANIHLPTSAINSLKVDGASIPASQIVTHPNNPYYSVALARFIGPAAQHTIVCDSTFTSTVYGLGNYESYGYNVGTLINNLNNYSAIQNTFNTTNTEDTFSCPKTPFKIFVKLGYPATSITWKLSQVSGISPSTDSVVTNPILIRTESINGRTYYVYGLQQDFSFANAGTYFIPVTYTATVIQNCSQSENAAIKVVIKPGPVADFVSTAPSCIKDSVHFTGTISAAGFNIIQYKWNFDDNTTANTINTVKKFNTAGTQHVRFRIYADNGCAADTTKQLTINSSPIAKFGVAAISCAKDSVYITDTSSIASGSINSWQYDFGDGNTLTRTSNTAFYHTYNLPGTYTIKLVTSSNNSCLSDTAYRTVTVNARPLAKFGYDKNICVGDSIHFSDSSSIASGNINNWRWDFGDGPTLVLSNNNPFYHPYTTVGNYMVKLVTVSNNGCASDTFKLTVSVNNLPIAGFTMNGIACVDSSYNFVSSIGLGTGNPPNWYWNFGDGQILSTSTTNTASHVYTTAANNLLVKHVVSYGAGCTSDTAIKTIPIININPVASFTIVGDTLCENKTINFIGSATPNNVSWNWQIGSFNTTAAPPINYAFTNAGNYTANLKVTVNGCSSPTYTKNLTINTTPVINAGPDKIVITGASTIIDAFTSNASNYNFTWLPALNLSSSTILNPMATPPSSMVYTIQAMDKISFCMNRDSMKITVINKLVVPNAFSPNGDNINDQWAIEGLELYPDASVSIFTRGGQKIFETRNYKSNPWNGTSNGKPLPVGTYYYIIKFYTYKNDSTAGALLLIR
jgi:gliding motility-associated-like protein